MVREPFNEFSVQFIQAVRKTNVTRKRLNNHDREKVEMVAIFGLLRPSCVSGRLISIFPDFRNALQSCYP